MLSEDNPGERRLEDAQSILALNPGWTLLRCQGDSMKPYFGENDLIIIERNQFDSLDLGMIVVYRDNSGDRVAHQVIARVKENFRARGHGNALHDRILVSKSNYLGTVVAILRADQGPEEMLSRRLAALPIARCKGN